MIHRTAKIALTLFCLCGLSHAQGTPVDTVNGDMASKLASAAQKGDFNAVKELVAQGAPVNGAPDYNGGSLYITPLEAAAQSGTGSYSRGRWPWTNQYDSSSPDDYLGIAKFLIESGADVNGTYSAGYKSTALMEAVASGHLKMVQLLLEKGADVQGRDGFGLTSLMVAAPYPSIEIVRLLLKHGANVNEINAKGYTPLMAAVLGHIDVVKLLLSKGANVNATTKTGATALMLAADSVRYIERRENLIDYPEKSDIVRLLLSKGARVNAQTDSGTTALLRAVHNGAFNVVKALLEGGADPNLRDTEQGSSLDLARRLHNKWEILHSTSGTKQWSDLMIPARRIVTLLEKKTGPKRGLKKRMELQSGSSK